MVIVIVIIVIISVCVVAAMMLLVEPVLSACYLVYFASVKPYTLA
jgi:hypothetical protein